MNLALHAQHRSTQDIPRRRYEAVYVSTTLPSPQHPSKNYRKCRSFNAWHIRPRKTLWE